MKEFCGRMSIQANVVKVGRGTHEDWLDLSLPCKSSQDYVVGEVLA